MRTITRYTDIPLNTVYYREIYDPKGKDGYVSWTRLYDKDMNVIEDAVVRISFRNLLAYHRVCTEKQTEDIVMSAYRLEDLGNGYYEVLERGDALRELEQIAKTIRGKKA